jgi:hypothetical protein
MDHDQHPDALATICGHLLTSLLALVIVRKLTKQSFPAVMAALVAVIIHVKFDAPVARRLSQLGL